MRYLVVVFGWGLALATGIAAAAAPNILVVLTDDLGFSDLGCYGSEIATPNLDRLAANGVRFTQFSNTAKCHSSRVSLLSGLYCRQAGDIKLTRAVIIPEMLGPAGYFTAMTGKWHLSREPTEFGFDRYFGHLSGATDYYRGNDSFRLNGRPWPVPKQGFYTTVADVDYAIGFLGEARAIGKPWFLYVAFNAPHAPLQPLEADYKKHLGRYDVGWDAVRAARVAKQRELGLFGRDIEPSPRPEHVPAWETLPPETRAWESRRMAAYAALIDRVDQELGRLFADLERAGEFENTFVLFLSDNGACPYDRRTAGRDREPSEPGMSWSDSTGWAWARNTPFRYYKQNQFEGGITTPAESRSVTGGPHKTRHPSCSPPEGFARGRHGRHHDRGARPVTIGGPALASRAAAADRNIVLFVTDDESPTLGCYGDPVAATPAIDALAADGTLFTHAFATTASCSASRSVILSGVHNHANGQYGHQHDFHKFASWHDLVSLSLPRALAGVGYRTGRIGKFHVAPEEVYHFEHTIAANERNPVAMAEACRAFVTAADDRPFFLYFATADPHRGGGVDAASPLELKPDLFGNLPERGHHPGVAEVFFKSEEVPVPAFLPDTPETRAELAEYYQSCARVDQGLARLVAILREAGVYDQTLIVFTSDHGIAFPGGKTTVYEPGLRVPLVVRDPSAKARGVRSAALVSHVDLAPSLLDFAGGLDRERNRPRAWVAAADYWKDKPHAARENRGPRRGLSIYQGRSWLPILGDPRAEHHETLFASHTFHEIQMYYPMRAVRDRQYKLIWNIAHPLPYPFASDLWAASSWQAQHRRSLDAPWGRRTVGAYIHRPRFELYDLAADPDESVNLANDPEHAETLERYQARLRQLQRDLGDPWESKWNYE